MESLCEICGNERSEGSLFCPYCGTKYPDGGLQKLAPRIHRVINIEIGRPTVAAALQKLDRQLQAARNESVAVVTVIHGYGASGHGGAIRLECRKTLDYLLEKKAIKGYIPGEQFSRKEGRTRTLLRRLPKLSGNENLNKGNRGVTLVEL